MDQVPGRRIRTLGFTPQMVRYAPGQNPRGEDTGATSNDEGMENAYEATAIHKVLLNILMLRIVCLVCT